jgi:multiple sugar transport system substrate-binding protein
MQAFLTNNSKIKSLGLEPPGEDITYDEFKALSEQLVEVLPDGEYVISDPTVTEHAVEIWAVQRGGSFISEDGTTLGFTKEDLADYWAYWNELREMGAIPPAHINAEQVGIPEESTLFAQGKAVFLDRPTNRAQMFQGFMPDAELSITRFPLMADGASQGGEQLQVPAILMNKDTEHKEEAAKLINWFVNDLQATEIYAAENGIPGTSAVRDHLAEGLQPMNVQAFEHFDRVVGDIPVTNMRPEGSASILSAYTRHSEAVAFGQVSVEDAVEAFFKEAEGILAD